MVAAVSQRLGPRALGRRARGARPYAEARPPHFFVFLLVLISLTGAAGTARASDLEAASALVEGGAGALALETLDRQAPAPGEPGWGRWARLRVRALELLGRWEEILDRADGIPEEAPPSYRQWVQLRAGDLELAHGRPRAARRRLASLVAAYPEAEAVRSWLRRIYRAYAAEGRTEDARVAIMRHRLGEDAGALDPGQRLEQARILARAGVHGEALRILGEDHSSGPARRLRIRLLSAEGKGQAALEAARVWAQETDAPEAWMALAEVAVAQNRPRDRIMALEMALNSGGKIEAAEVWEAYLQHGEWVANEAGLLVGEEGKWLDLAAGTGSGVRERSLLASVALAGHSVKARQRARLGLLDAQTEAELPGVGQRLFREGPAFRREGALSPEVLVRLSRQALEADELENALEWMERVESLPPQVDPAPWWLTRGRLRIELAAYRDGAEDLDRILEHPAWVEEKGFRDRFLQVVFDLQEAERHELALRILEKTFRIVKADSARRELLFWMAESREGLGEYRAAATLYLRSAGHPPGQMTDPWARTARFRAAGALEETEFTSDARRLYRDLLGQGSSEQELAVRRRLRRLEESD